MTGYSLRVGSPSTSFIPHREQTVGVSDRMSGSIGQTNGSGPYGASSSSKGNRNPLSGQRDSQQNKQP